MDAANIKAKIVRSPRIALLFIFSPSSFPPLYARSSRLIPGFRLSILAIVICYPVALEMEVKNLPANFT
jgi:hypothetical protein